MFQNYLKTAVRNLSRHRLFVVVNILGLGTALACCIVTFLNFTFDRDFDAFHERRDHLFRVNVFKESNGQLYGITPLALAGVVADDLAGVERAARLYSVWATVKQGEVIFEESVKFADPDLLTMFTFPIAFGNPGALADRNQILLTQKAAVKYFGDEDPLGRTLMLFPGTDRQRVLEVGGVLEDIPLNSSLQFDFLTHIENLTLEGEAVDLSEWKMFANATFLELAAGADPAVVQQELDRYVPVWNKSRQEWAVRGFALEALPEMAHHARALRANYLHSSFPPAAIWGPNIMAVLLLLTACLNFTNTTISLSDRRLKEMGVRKVLGSTRRQLIGQLLSESFVLILLALLAGLAIAEILIPPYNSMWPYLHLEANYLQNPELLLFLGGILLLTGLAAGAYPAFYISGFNAVRIFRGRVHFGGNNLFTRILLGVQVILSLTAVIVGLVFSRNARFQEEADMGYDRQGIIGMYIDGEQDYRKLADELSRNPQVLMVAGSPEHIGFRMLSAEFESQGEKYESLRLRVGDGYLELMDLDLTAGRSFEKGRGADSLAVIVNEKLVEEFGWEDPLGRQMRMDSTVFTVIGVASNFLQSDFFTPIRPVFFTLGNPEDYSFLVVRTDPAAEAEVQGSLKVLWSSLFPYHPYSGFFQSEVLSEELTINHNIKWIFIFLAIVMVLLSATGLFALVSLNILKRMKEIALRRVMGASPAAIAVLINRSYLWIFGGAAILGSLGGGYLSVKLLSSIFAIHTGTAVDLFLLAVLGFLAIGAATVLGRLYRVLRISPASVLKSE